MRASTYRLKPSLKVPLYNGSLECELRKYVLFDGRLDSHRAAGGTVKTDEERRQMAQKRRFKQHRDDFKRSSDDRDDRGEDRMERGDHRFNKYSKRGRGGRNDDSERGEGHGGRGFRGDSSERGGRGGGRGEGRGDGKGHRGGGHDYRQKGNDRAARQEARRRFFGGQDEED